MDLLSLTQLKQVAGATPQPYRVQAQVDGVSRKTSSQGKPYLDVKLADAQDSITWRVFDNNPLFDQAAGLGRGTFVELAALWVDTGKYGLEPRQPALRILAEEERQSLLSGSGELAQAQERDFATIAGFISSLADPRLRALCHSFLARFGERFRRTAAARELHHARRGGLVEHVAQMMRSADAIAGVYPALNRDLMIAGVLFHDCGKLWETCYQENTFSMPHHLHGEMLGHISLGLELVNKLWRELMDGPDAAGWAMLEPASELVRLHLLHLIAAHHGEYQFGSPVLPKTPEAVALHYVDNLDAKLEMLRRGYETSAELAPGILERMRPWPVNILTPLAAFHPAPEATATEPPPAADPGEV